MVPQHFSTVSGSSCLDSNTSCLAQPSPHRTQKYYNLSPINILYVFTLYMRLQWDEKLQRKFPEGGYYIFSIFSQFGRPRHISTSNYSVPQAHIIFPIIAQAHLCINYYFFKCLVHHLLYHWDRVPQSECALQVNISNANFLKVFDKKLI